MAKLSEETLNKWRQPPSDFEETKLSNSESLIRNAISGDDKLYSMDLNVFGQGSYANDTNVRLNSDIDINVCYQSAFYYGLPEGSRKEDFGLNNPVSYSFYEFKNDVEIALVNYFGRNEVIRTDKCLRIKGNTTRIEADVIPTWEHHRYTEDGKYIIGTVFFSDKGTQVINYPFQHIENGKIKNAKTQKRFKRLTRILKRILFKMISDNPNSQPAITSFLLESLAWNTPNETFNNHDSWTERLKETIRHIYEITKTQDKCKECGEVSDLLYLFHAGRKWKFSDVNLFMQDLWTYLEY